MKLTHEQEIECANSKLNEMVKEYERMLKGFNVTNNILEIVKGLAQYRGEAIYYWHLLDNASDSVTSDVNTDNTNNTPSKTS